MLLTVLSFSKKKPTNHLVAPLLKTMAPHSVLVGTFPIDNAEVESYHTDDSFFEDASSDNSIQDPEDLILNHLTPDEIEIAARTSYAYVKDNTTDASLHKQTRLRYAKLMARRYLDSTGGQKHYTKALARMKKTLQFRRKIDIDGLRECMSNPQSEYHAHLTKELSSRHLYVQGYDREGRSTYVFLPRRVQGHDPVWTIRAHMWTLEKAIACSRTEDQTVNAVVDFNGFSTIRHAPPTSIGKELMQTLRAHYVGHINQIFLIDAPTAFLCLWAVFKPFAGKVTRSKINFLSSERQKQDVISRWYADDQAPSWMLPSGTKNRDLDLDEYLYQTPFDKAFDQEVFDKA